MAKKKKYYGGNSMMSSGMGDVAGLPKNVVMKNWPRTGLNGREDLNDGISGIDKQVRDDMKGKKRMSYPEKY